MNCASAPAAFASRQCWIKVYSLWTLETARSAHDPNRPEDVLKVDANEDGDGGDGGGQLHIQGCLQFAHHHPNEGVAALGLAFQAPEDHLLQTGRHVGVVLAWLDKAGAVKLLR